MRIEYERIQQDQNSSFSAQSFVDSTFLCPYHIHDEYELVLIVEGRGRVVAGDYSGRFEPGELYLFGPNLPHTFFSDTLYEGEELRAHSHYIQFKMNCFGDEFFKKPEMADFYTLLCSSERGLMFSGFDFQKIMDCFIRVEESSEILKIACFLELQSYIVSCEYCKKMATEQYVHGGAHHDSERLDRAIDYIYRRFTKHITLDDVAHTAHLSSAAFSRFFRKQMGQRFIDYLIELRLSEACRLLLETDLSITEISAMVGFKNLSNFNRQFLKRKEVSPREFRASKG